jgi:hypothetical protein
MKLTVNTVWIQKYISNPSDYECQKKGKLKITVAMLEKRRDLLVANNMPTNR